MRTRHGASLRTPTIMNHNWEYKRLGDVCSFIGGGTPSKSNSSYYCGTIPWATVRDMTKFELSSTELSISEKAVAESATKILPKGMIIISTHVGLGKICLLMQDTAINQDLKGISFLFNEINKYFFSYWYRSIANYIISNGKGATVKGVTLDFMKSLPIPTPSMQIQEKIVSELDKINELIEVKRSQLKDLDALAQSLFYETFGDPIDNPMRWNVGILSDHADFKNGLNFTPSDNGNKVKCLGVGDFKANRYIKAENLSEFSIVESISEDYLLTKGDIIFVRSNGNKALIGRSIMYVSNDSPATFSGFCIRCRYNSDILSPLFLSYYLSSRTVREYITSQGRGCNISNLNQKILSSIPLMLPPLSLQNQFASKIEAIEAQKKLVEASIADLETLFASRMDYWFND